MGFLWNKCRDFAAEKLKDGDTTDQKFREIIVRDLNDIKTTLDCLSRKDLLSSYNFLKEGVLLLNLVLDQSPCEHTTISEQDELNREETTDSANHGECDILNEALSLAHITKLLNFISDKNFKSAKDLFKAVREKATEAFWNESLNVKERIMACKLRVVARILECLENPNTAVTGCALFLEELHSLSSVRETFSVYLSGRLKSLWNKAERFENVKSVVLTNYVIFEFAATFASVYPDINNWPTIELPERHFNPVCSGIEVCIQAPKGEMIQLPKHFVCTESVHPHVAAINSRSEIITRSGSSLKIVATSKKSKVVEFSQPENGKLVDQILMAIAVDGHDNVYVILWVKTEFENNSSKSHVLYILDNNYNIKHH